MPDVDVLPPFEAYRGKESYIFVSYAHKDGKGECDKALPTWGELEVVSHEGRR